MQLTLLDSDHPQFPCSDSALTDPNGLLAIGGNLNPDTLLNAYRHGIFPWFADGEPLLWWSPDPRAVIVPTQLHVSRSLAKLQRQQRYRIAFDSAFAEVVRCCSAPRQHQDGTWITESMQAAYRALHQLGHAHSVEVWEGDQLVGGLYGVAVGGTFCGESMFSRQPNTSKLALAALAQLPQLTLIDCQIPNPHLDSLGAIALPRSDFLGLLRDHRGRNIDWPVEGPLC